MKKVVNDAKTGQPAMSFKQRWNNNFQVFADPNFGQLILEARFVRKFGLAWDIYETGQVQPLARMESHILKTALSMGGEVISVTKPEGGEFIKVERESSSALKHIMDNMVELYNPTHVYTVKAASGKVLGAITAKHGVWKSFYDFKMDDGTDKERAAALMVFAYILIMLKK